MVEAAVELAVEAGWLLLDATVGKVSPGPSRPG
jgi:hypothetical protein